MKMAQEQRFAIGKTRMELDCPGQSNATWIKSNSGEITRIMVMNASNEDHIWHFR
jgi:hypothetical protein